MAELIRTRLERGSRRRTPPSRDPLLDVVGIIHDGKLAHDIDEELYDSE
jgi:hypothetical protein